MHVLAYATHVEGLLAQLRAALLTRADKTNRAKHIRGGFGRCSAGNQEGFWE